MLPEWQLHISEAKSGWEEPPLNELCTGCMILHNLITHNKQHNSQLLMNSQSKLYEKSTTMHFLLAMNGQGFKLHTSCTKSNSDNTVLACEIVSYLAQMGIVQWSPVLATNGSNH